MGKLKPIRKHLAHLNAIIATAECEMVEKIERWGHDDAEYAYQKSKEYYRSVEPLCRERDAVAKVIADYYALQPIMTDTRPKCAECNGRGIDGWGGTCTLCGGQGREPFREWGKEEDEDQEELTGEKKDVENG